MDIKKLTWEYNPTDRPEFSTMPLVAVSKIDIKVLDYFYVEVRDCRSFGGGFKGTLYTHNRGSLITGPCETKEEAIIKSEKAINDFVYCFLE